MSAKKHVFKSFWGGNCPSIDHLDPLPASATDYEVRVLSSKRKRKSLAQQSTLEIPFSKSRKLTLEISFSKSRKKRLVSNQTEHQKHLTL